MSRVGVSATWRALVLGDGIGPSARQTSNERQALALASALLRTKAQNSTSIGNAGWNVQTASLDAIQHPMPRLFRPFADESASTARLTLARLARSYLPTAIAGPVASLTTSPTAPLPAPFSSLGDQSCTLVIAAGPAVTLPALSTHKEMLGSKVVHVQSPVGVPDSQFDAIVAASYEFAPGTLRSENVVTTSLALHDVTSQRLAAHAAKQPCDDIRALQTPRLAILLGGPESVLSRGKFWTDEGASRLARQIASVVGSTGSAVITASDRTPDSFALRLQRRLVSKLGASRVIYDEGSSRARYLFILATSDALVVTADSLIMMSEAVSSVSAPIAMAGSAGSPQSQRLVESLVSAGRAAILDDAYVGTLRARLGQRTTAVDTGAFRERSDTTGADDAAADVWKVLLR